MDANARRLLRHDAPAAARAALARAQLASFADFAVEMAAAGRRHGSADDLLAGVEGPEHLARALEPGKGVVAVTLHIGNYELAAASLAPRVPGGVAIVYDRDPSRRWERRRSRWRDTAGIGSIALGGSPFFAVDALALLKRGGAALVAADQVERRTGETFLFLGAPAVFSLFPARLAASAGAPILPAFAVRAPGGRRLLHLDPPIFPGTRDARDVTAELLIVLERFLSDHAGEWLMLRRFWSE
jgi:KDO2-lipid IV(A) lauroyltransferase